eukprot:12481945-Alexandrium_andersonii.AAC.1
MPDRGTGWQRLQCGHTFYFGRMARHREVGRDARKCPCCRSDVGADWQRLEQWEGMQDAAAPA